MPSLPLFAPFPSAELVHQIEREEWAQTVASWNTLSAAYLGDSTSPSPTDFLLNFTKEAATDSTLLDVPAGPSLAKHCLQLAQRSLTSGSCPERLLDWPFLLDLCQLYRTHNKLKPLLSSVFKNPTVENNLGSLKKYLIKNLDDGLKGDLRGVEERLARLNSLVYASPDAASFFLAGSDFVDGLISCYKIPNPPLRKTIVATAFLCLVGIIGGDSPKFGMLTDQLYSLKAAAQIHKKSTLNVNDSMVAELVTQTLLIKKVKEKSQAAGSSQPRLVSVIKELEAFRKPEPMRIPSKVGKRPAKGKALAWHAFEDEAVSEEIRQHRESQIRSVKEVFPDVGPGFISRMLDAFGDSKERVIGSLLDGSIPDHLVSADRTEGLQIVQPPPPPRRSSLVPRSTPPVLPARHNAFDDDELDRLTLNTSKLRFGKSDTQTADDLLAEQPTAASKAATLAILATFDADDDERDDTYDADDVGGTIDADNGEEISAARERIDEVLFKAYVADPKLFARDSSVRNGIGRARLCMDTGETHEAIEGWAIMLEQNPGRKKKMERQFGLFSGAQVELAPSHWTGRNEDGGSDTDASGSSSRGHGGPYRGRGGSGRGRGRGGNVAGPADDKSTLDARKRKEANKGQRANHNRRNQRAKKMARGGGGFPG